MIEQTGQTKVSVIVPIYNTVDYLEDCFDSLRAQSLSDIEIILVDDGSTDGSQTICDAYVARDCHFKVVHTIHGGPSAARNIGIRMAQSDYLMFVDSDDWVEPDYCKVPYEDAVANGSDIVMFRQRRHLGRRIIEPKDCQHVGRIEEDKALWLLDTVIGNSQCNKLYRRELFSGIQFPEGVFYEDLAILHKLVHASRAIYLNNSILYNYRYREGSTTTIQTHEIMDGRFDIAFKRILEIESWGFDCSGTRQQEALLYLARMGSGEKRSGYCKWVLLADASYEECRSYKQKIGLLLYKHAPLVFDAVCCLSGRRIKQSTSGPGG